jgi:hypothetical protein
LALISNRRHLGREIDGTGERNERERAADVRHARDIGRIGGNEAQRETCRTGLVAVGRRSEDGRRNCAGAATAARGETGSERYGRSTGDNRAG